MVESARYGLGTSERRRENVSALRIDFSTRTMSPTKRWRRHRRATARYAQTSPAKWRQGRRRVYADDTGPAPRGLRSGHLRETFGNIRGGGPEITLPERCLTDCVWNASRSKGKKRGESRD